MMGYKRRTNLDGRKMEARENYGEEVTFNLRLEGQVEVCHSAK